MLSHAAAPRLQKTQHHHLRFVLLVEHQLRCPVAAGQLAAWGVTISLDDAAIKLKLCLTICQENEISTIAAKN